MCVYVYVRVCRTFYIVAYCALFFIYFYWCGLEWSTTFVYDAHRVFFVRPRWRNLRPVICFFGVLDRRVVIKSRVWTTEGLSVSLCFCLMYGLDVLFFRVLNLFREMLQTRFFRACTFAIPRPARDMAEKSRTRKLEKVNLTRRRWWDC